MCHTRRLRPPDCNNDTHIRDSGPRLERGRHTGRAGAGSAWLCRFSIGALRLARKLDPRARCRRIGKEAGMLKFLGTTMGIIFLIGLLVVIGLFALIF
jgi:hypothetical protein